MIEVIRETTGLVGDFMYQPHIYYLNKKSGKLVAFKTAPDYTNLKVFNKALKFDKRKRTFEKLKELENIECLS